MMSEDFKEKRRNTRKNMLRDKERRLAKLRHNPSIEEDEFPFKGNELLAKVREGRLDDEES